MTTLSSFGSVHLDANPSASSSAAVLEPESPFRILLIGDFSGRAANAAKASTRWKAVEIDRDNFEDVLASMAPEFAGMKFRELDDLHPDRIYRESLLFQALREVRLKLEQPATFAEAAAQIRAWDNNPEAGAAATAEQKPAPEVTGERPRPPLPNAASGMSLLDSIVEAEESEVHPSVKRRDDFQAFVERAVAPFTVPAERPELAKLRARWDAETGLRMRAVLQHARFQALEAAWRAMFHVVREVETGSRLKLYLLDVSKAELEADLSGAEDLRESEIWRILVEEAGGTDGATGGDPWSVVAGNYTYARTPGDAEMLGRLAKVMSSAGAPFLAEADPGNRGSETEETVRQWEQLRQLPEACWIGLAMPRFLLRLPYGQQTDPIESFEFEEMLDAPRHQEYLWGNPAFLCVELLAAAFASDGWEMRPGSHVEIDRLPVHIYEDDGEKQAKPCAEVLLTERDIDWILEQGYMALASIRGRDAVRLVRFQSIASPAARLSGRWE